ncbi:MULTISPECIES: SoxR reducing system RseC family protein [Thiorhodovibrio]|uniref:SoxR reducing system RseC family protein n=1 Tax=Thiorhodovibrio TaxID=61593 RepID=UPI001913B400|nr:MULTISPECIES: SoxR reducing system RseC family protein [Thiorhodovibrio]MBK5970163.1 hypothetical protein [Thiorhodovibrio winogradskyi]WPL14005.1 SoxR reducing system protein RseC [Thiorhodovibrio litoralis]
MIEQSGRVLAVRAAAEGQSASLQVELPRRSACGGCEQASGCGTAALAGAFGERALRVDLDIGSLDIGSSGADANPWRPGDAIRLGIAPGALIGAALLAYVLPVVLMLLGALLGTHLGSSGWGSALWGSDGLSVLLAGAGLFGGLGLGRWLIDRSPGSPWTQFELSDVRVADADGIFTGRAAMADPVDKATETMTETETTTGGLR